MSNDGNEESRIGQILKKFVKLENICEICEH